MNNVFCDGGHKSSLNISGWAFCDETEYNKYSEKGAWEGGTNQQAELIAMREALKYVDGFGFGYSFTIYSDSAYVVNGLNNKWYVNWRKNGWKNSKKQPVANKELWEDILEILENTYQDVSIAKIKGHSTSKGNNLADELVNLAMDKLEEEIDTYGKKS